MEDRDDCIQNGKVSVTVFLRCNGGQILWFVFLAKKLVKSYIWSTAFYGADTWTLQKVDHIRTESFEMWCWRELEKMKLTNGVEIGEVLYRVKEKQIILHTVKRRKVKWIGYTLRWYYFLKYIFEGKLEKLGR